MTPPVRNPASPFALTLSELRRLPEGRQVLACMMSPYSADDKVKHRVVIHVNQIIRVEFLGLVPCPSNRQDWGGGNWIVLNHNLGFSAVYTVEIERERRYAYEPTSLGLVASHLVDRQNPGWHEMNCIILPEREADFRREYPRRLL